MKELNFQTLHNDKVKSNSFLNYKSVTLALIISILNCPTYPLIYAPTIDGSLFWVFNYFADGHYELCRQTLFPHGPLAFLNYPTTIGNNLFIASTLHVSIAFIFALTCFKIKDVKGILRLFLTSFLIFLFLAFADIQLLLIALSSCLIFLFNKTQRNIYLISAIAFCVFNLYLKAYGGAVCMMLLTGFTLQQILSKNSYTLVFKVAVWYVFFFLLTWLLIYKKFDSSLTFLYGQLQLLFDNSEAVQFNTPHNWWLLSGFLICLVGYFILIYSKEKTHFLFAFILPLFAAWKHAMARSEETHLTGLSSFLMMMFLLTLLTTESNDWPKLICLGIGILFFQFNIPFNDNRALNNRIADFVRFSNFYKYTSQHDSISKITKSYTDYYCRNSHLSDSLLKLIGKNSVDVYPHNYSFVATNNFNWQPRPILNSYAAYTKWLDKKDAEHWDSETAPKFVIWECGDFDGRGAELESIDGRFLLNDEPKAVLRFFANYSLVQKSGSLLIYKKREQALKITSNIELQKDVEMNEWIEVPEVSHAEVLRAKVFINKNIIGSLKSFFYKGEIFYLNYQFEDNTRFYHRIVPKNAEDGLWINPMVLHPGKNFNEKKVKYIKLTCINPNMVKSSFKIEFEKIKFDKLSTEYLINKVFIQDK